MVLISVTKATYDALNITATGMLGIFIFMFIFYVSIRLIDKYFPEKK